MNFILKYLVLIILPYQCITIYRIRHELIDELDLDFEEFVPGKLSFVNIFFYCLRIFDIMNLLLKSQIILFHTLKILHGFISINLSIPINETSNLLFFHGIIYIFC